MSNMCHCPNCDRDYPNSKPACIYCGAANPNYDNSKSYEDDGGETEPYDNRGGSNDDNKTTIYNPRADMAVTPVVGWLVCTAGKDKGKDFRLHVDNNFVGRNADQDIRLNDKKVSRQRHFSVAYSSEDDQYFVAMGGGTGLVRINGKHVGGLTYLNKGDKIRVGDTTLVFIPLETAYVQWEW